MGLSCPQGLNHTCHPQILFLVVFGCSDTERCELSLSFITDSDFLSLTKSYCSVRNVWCSPPPCPTLVMFSELFSQNLLLICSPKLPDSFSIFLTRLATHSSPVLFSLYSFFNIEESSYILLLYGVPWFHRIQLPAPD